VCGVELAISDDHPGLKQVIFELLPHAVWQLCYVHFLRNAVDHLPRKRGDCRTDLGWVSDRRDLEEARGDMAGMAWQVAGQIPEAVRLGGRQNRTDLLLLPFAAPTSQAREAHQHAGAVQPGDQAADPHRAHFPEWRELPAAGPGAGGGDP